MTSAKRILVTADGVCDLPKALLDRLDVHLIPFRIVTPHGRFLDGMEVDAEGLAQYLFEGTKKAVPESPGAEAYRDFFRGLAGPETQILHIALASPEYGAYSEACVAAEDLQKEDEKKAVTVFNSGQVSSGLGLLVLAACVFAGQCESMEEVVEKISEYRKHIVSSFVLPAMPSREEGEGRGWKQTFYSRLLLRPLFTLKNGRIRADGLWFGRAATVIRKYVRFCLRNAARIDPEVLFITHFGLPPERIALVRSEAQRYVDFQRIFVVETSAAVLCGCGPGAFGLFYVTKGKAGLSSGSLLNTQ